MQTLVQLSSGELQGATTLKLSEGLTEFPLEIFSLAETLEYLDLSGNQLCRLPDDFGRLSKLRVFFASDNLFTSLPDVLSDCPVLSIAGFKSNQIEHIGPAAINANLKWLILTNNRITDLPSSIGDCVHLQKLMLAGNQLTALPESLVNCRNLALLRISANRLDHLPQWLISMPGLAWLAFSGNEIQQNATDFPDLATIDVEQITLMNMLGEGASGTIYRASLLVADLLQDAAVKIFKGNVTSDGYPQDEMRAYIAAGAHPAIVKLLGKIHFSHEDRNGVVMELIPQEFFNLGRPPSLDSCTRDIFEDEVTLSAQQLLEIAKRIADVGLHLHSKGIIHGDLYAHNILVDPSGKTLFGDFGAASFYNRSNDETAFSLERIEVKAYGYLLDDLLSITRDEFEAYQAVCLIRDRCLAINQNDRPGFKQIVKELGVL
ncbi:protein kinase [Pedobacter frigidisoli]|uniref:protein kinase n=1 Tax=Pedobacter frigidisoli TaxID=2530455 RepID=UPI00292E4BB1|nr:protein kinase [Pedobacter frigidisoli]